MKKRIRGIILLVACLFLCACGKDDVEVTDLTTDKETLTNRNNQGTEDDKEAYFGYMNMNVSFDSSVTEELRTFEVRYYVGEELITTKKISDGLETGKRYDIGFDVEVLNGSDYVTVVYIINGNMDTKCVRNYQVNTEENLEIEIYFNEEKNCYDSVLAG